MITNKDITKLASILATKVDIEEIREDISDIRESTRNLMTATDNILQTVTKLAEEYKSIVHVMDDHGKRITKLESK